MLLCIVFHYELWVHVFFALRNHRTAVQVLDSDDMKQESSGSHRIWEFKFSGTAILRQFGETVGY